MNEAVLWIARSPQPLRALDETMAVLERLLAGLRIHKPAAPEGSTMA